MIDIRNSLIPVLMTLVGCATVHSSMMRSESHGATFTVYLPLERRVASAKEEEATLHGEFASLRGTDLLLVEDETGARGATQFLLEQHGATVRSVKSAAQAREALALRRPDVLIADIGMPDEDGYAFLQSVRRSEREQNLSPVPAVAVTAFARVQDRERALAAGFNEHLPKPVDPENLIWVLAQLISASG